jgi:hypothetical protein
MPQRPCACNTDGDRIPLESPWLVWVRVCAECGEHDLEAAFGREALVDDGPWTCRRCPATTFALHRLPLR